MRWTAILLDAAADMINRAAAMAAPAVAYLTLAFAAPILVLSASSLWVDGRPSLENYVKYLGDPYYLGVIGNSLKLALAACAITLVVSYPAAFALARARPVTQRIALACIFLPLTVGSIVKAFGWTIAFQRNGVINHVAMALGLVATPLPLLFSPTALYVGISNMFLPYMLMPLFSAVRMIDDRLPEAAATLGAGPVFRFVRLVLPLTLPGAISGVALVFSLSLASYAGPLLLVGARYPTMTTTIVRGYLELNDRGLGSTMAVSLLLLAGLAISLAGWLGRKAEP
jgi:putative spermidine/putrescine transport system permease protein